MKKRIDFAGHSDRYLFAVIPASAADAKADTIAEVKSMAVGSRVMVFGEVQERPTEKRFVLGDTTREIA